MMSFLYLTLHPAIVYLHTNIKALCLKTNTLSLFFFKVSPLQPMLKGCTIHFKIEFSRTMNENVIVIGIKYPYGRYK
jgi:hypothetical protein